MSHYSALTVYHPRSNRLHLCQQNKASEQVMRQSIFFLLLASLLLTACNGSKNIVGIPPYQQFILGETQNTAFKVTIENKSDLELKIETRNMDNVKTSGFGMARKGTVDLTIGADEMAVIINPNGESAILDVSLFEEVQGMRYEVLEGENNIKPLLIESDKLTTLHGAWKGSLTYRDYSSSDIVTIPAELDISMIDPWNLTFHYKYPDEPHMNGTTNVVYDEEFGYFEDHKIVEVNNESDMYKIVTRYQDRENDKDANIFITYLISANKFVMRKEFQTIGSDEIRFRNEYNFFR